MSDQLQIYLDQLIEPNKGHPHSQTGDWQEAIEAWEAEHGPSPPSGPSTAPLAINPELLLTTLPPTLLDHVHDTAASSRASPSPQGKGTRSDLGQRLHRHLPHGPYRSLINLLSSPRSNEDIQSELVEILGFEGEGLTLTEQLLRPGTRQALVDSEEDDAQLSNPLQLDNLSHFKASAVPYLPTSRIQANTSQRKGRKKETFDLRAIGSAQEVEQRLQAQLNGPRAMFSSDGARVTEQEKLPNVFSSAANVTAAMSMGGRLALPAGTEREIFNTYEEVTVPPNVPVPPKQFERIVRIADLPPLARGCFSYATLNRMQSTVQPTAMNTNENMLICAPTGAGKTDVAIMSIIRVLSSHTREGPSTHPSGFSLDLNAFKIIYVAPMKALAAEITRKFAKRLAWLGVKVRELTGDMQLTRQEISETQVIVTTPEKWDVVTRKPTAEGELASKVRLLIIDEVHLLNEDRGAVIETIVARTLRQVESSQSLIRIVGLSATLPNYIDVGDFLRVNRYTGLFFFDSSFRPVPLQQHFIGVAGKPRSQAAIRNMDQVVFDKVADLVRQGHQVMVFVHARKETVKTAQKLLEMAREEGAMASFDPREHPKFDFFRREMGASRNKEMRQLFDDGFGIHHAGMLRSDRNMMEKMFEAQCIRVLCCTSTLAWGVNLPAHAVVIKGTQVYDSSKGSFQDLSVLDVLQIFGRAGRPGYETSGEGYICTTQDKLDHYLYSIMAQHPIESKFQSGMTDSLNAEISLGTIANVSEAIQWLGYTYLFVRMKREPFIYGMSHDEPIDDPQLGNKRNKLIVEAAKRLQNAKMIRFDDASQTFIISDLGRIAAKYYLRYQTMEIFNKLFEPRMKNADLFAMLCQATEFEQIQIRETENDELTAILESDHCPMEVKGGTTDKYGKVNILLQAYISKVYIEDFALVSDSAYVAQNAARIIRALLEIALSSQWANCATLLIDLSKAIEQRMWPYEHPLGQITTLHRDTLHNLRTWADDSEIADLRNKEATEIGTLIHMNEKHGTAIREAAWAFPLLNLTPALRPLSHDLLQISIAVDRSFEWNTRLSGNAEPFYIWVEAEDGLTILQWRSVLFRQTTRSILLEFTIPMPEEPPSTYTLVCASDRWLGSDDRKIMVLEDLVMPAMPPEPTPLLDIPFLKISCLDDPALEAAYSSYIDTLNNIQSQAFWTHYHTNANTLVAAPVQSGKSFLGEVAIWHSLRHNPDAVCVVMVPHRGMVQETVARIRSIAPGQKRVQVKGLYSLLDFEAARSTARSITVTCPSALLRLDDQTVTAFVHRLDLIVLEDLHLLDDAYELSVVRLLSLARPLQTRIVGLTSTLVDPTDLCTWLGVNQISRYIFTPEQRGNPILPSLKKFTIPHSSTLLRAMVKPAYDIIKNATLENGGAIIFVPSRAACKSVAADLVTQSGTEMDLTGFLAAPRQDVEPLLQQLKDAGLYEPVLHGVGYVLPGMAPTDLALVLELFASGILRALVAPRESCWTLPLHASTVILMGAQYTRITADGDRQTIDYNRQEVVRMQGFAAPPLSAAGAGKQGRMFIMCQAEQSSSISRTLSDGLPLESTIPALLARNGSVDAVEGLAKMLKARPAPPPPQANRPRIPDLRRRDLMDLLQWSYFALRARSNPTYYDLHPGQKQEQQEVSRMIDGWWRGQVGEYSEVPSALTSAFGSRMGSSVSGSMAGWNTSGSSQNKQSVQVSREGSAQSRQMHDGAVGQETEDAGRVGEMDGETTQ